MENIEDMEAKWVEDTNTEVKRATREWIDSDGVKHIVTEEEQVFEPIELGSIKEPKNSNIINIKISVPKDISKQIDKHRVDFFRMFDKLKCMR